MIERQEYIERFLKKWMEYVPEDDKCDYTFVAEASWYEYKAGHLDDTPEENAEGEMDAWRDSV